MEREISCRMLEVLFKAIKKSGFEPGRLAEGSGYELATLQDRNERIEWPAFVRVCANASKLWSGQELEDIGGAFFRTSLVRSILLPARLLFSPRGIYKWALGSSEGLGRHMVPSARNRYEELGPDRAMLELTMPPEYERCPEFFLITKGSVAGMPCALGLDAATVHMEEIPNGARYEIVYPEMRGFVYAIRRAITWPFVARAAARELKDAHESLVERHRELEDYRLNLERKVEERTAELQEAHDDLARTIGQLKAAQSVRERIFANINHEIRTPLSLITLAASDIASRSSKALDDRSKEHLNEIDRSVQRLLQLVDGLLLLAAGQEGKIRLRISQADAAAVVSQLVSTWQSVAEHHEVNLRYEGPERLAAQLDQDAFERSVTNLISNAIKFTPAGGTIEVSLVDDGDELGVTVRDTGIGIDPEFLQRIFDRFEQGRPAVRGTSRGSGIGLSIVRELVEAHGGTVSAQRLVSGGSLFRIRLPKEQRDVEGASTSGSIISLPAAPPETLLSKRRAETLDTRPDATVTATLLIAEDDDDLRRSLTEMIGEHFHVVAAPDGLSALALAKEHRPDLLVSDVGMPGMDGFELTRRFRELPGNRLAPAVLLTAYGTIQDRLQGFDAGAVDYVLKPFNPNELLARIHSQLALRDMALRLHESEKLASLGVMSAGLAHELRNPANAVSNAIPPLLKLLPADLLEPDQPVAQLLEAIEVGSEQLVKLSRQLLGFSHAGGLEGAYESAPSIVENAVRLCSGLLTDVDLVLDVDYHDDVWCSRTEILQVLTNLLYNAAQAAGSGGRVWLGVNRNAGSLRFEVSDSGPGIPDELRARVFDPFFTTKDPGVGTGLGLTISRTIASRHGGELRVVDSQRGTTFRLEIPIEESRLRAADDTSSEQSRVS